MERSPTQPIESAEREAQHTMRLRRRRGDNWRPTFIMHRGEVEEAPPEYVQVRVGNTRCVKAPNRGNPTGRWERPSDLWPRMIIRPARIAGVPDPFAFLKQTLVKNEERGKTAYDCSNIFIQDCVLNKKGQKIYFSK